TIGERIRTGGESGLDDEARLRTDPCSSRTDSAVEATKSTPGLSTPGEEASGRVSYATDRDPFARERVLDGTKRVSKPPDRVSEAPDRVSKRPGRLSSALERDQEALEQVSSATGRPLQRYETRLA